MFSPTSISAEFSSLSSITNEQVELRLWLSRSGGGEMEAKTELKVAMVEAMEADDGVVSKAVIPSSMMEATEAD